MKNVTVSIRMYNIGKLGDCFLLGFHSDADTSYVLIDFGAYGSGLQGNLDAILDDIRKVTKSDGVSKLAVMVGTHQHQDHVSGYYYLQDKLNDLKVEEIWLSWLDDPSDLDAKKYQGSVTEVKEAIKKAKNSVKNSARFSVVPSNVLNAVDSLFGFNTDDAPLGATTIAKAPQKAIEYLKSREGKVRFLTPGKTIGLPGLKDQVVVHVLGPPKNPRHLFSMDPVGNETLDQRMTAAQLSAKNLLGAVEGQETDIYEASFPFNSSYAIKKSDPIVQKYYSNYFNTSKAWRKIDEDWLAEMGRLALFLDDYINNSSLVLAFELVATGRILLFAADAQAGNWRSWRDLSLKGGAMTLDDLLGKTLIYKVGHHGSHNATNAEMLLKMTGSNLIALIPTDKADAESKNWEMPAPNLFKALMKQTRGRVIRMDTGHAGHDKDDESARSAMRKTLKQAGIAFVHKPLYTELTFTSTNV